jgi:uncharacterized protein (DUF488 family)
VILTTKCLRKPGTRRKESNSVEADVFTIGHSTRSDGEFLSLLEAYRITRLVDIRTIPKSRHNPQFNQDVLAKNLRDRGIEYNHIKGLGGLRHPLKDSTNTGWRNSSFRGYADYMQTKEFDEFVDQLIKFIAEERKNGGKVAFMCAEALPWRCHRSLVADALTVRGLHVAHIISQNSSSCHRITPFAKIRRNKINYPKAE